MSHCQLPLPALLKLTYPKFLFAFLYEIFHLSHLDGLFFPLCIIYGQLSVLIYHFVHLLLNKKEFCRKIFAICVGIVKNYMKWFNIALTGSKWKVSALDSYNFLILISSSTIQVEPAEGANRNIFRNFIILVEKQ